MINSIEKITIQLEDLRVNAFVFIPQTIKKDHYAIFTHGFTSHKGSILNWGSRLAEEGVPTILFDQPGHFLGSFEDINGFEQFKSAAPKIFFKAYEYLRMKFPSDKPKLCIGGHSLGALTALLALQDGPFPNTDTTCICVGFGLPPQGVTHIFKTPFYKSTLNLRSELVSKHLSPEVVFPWIKEAKEALYLTNYKIHFITGEDDAVVGKDGSERLIEQLEEFGNDISINKPIRLAHHLPELAAGHIKKFLKDQSFL